MVTSKQIFIGITITSITIFICSQFIKFDVNNNKKKDTETDDSTNNEMRFKLKRSKSKKKNDSGKLSRNKKKSNQNEETQSLEKNDILNKLEKLFSKKNYKIVEKIITQMLEESEHEKYLEWLSNQEGNIYIKTLNKDRKNQKLDKKINICVISKRDIVPGEIIYTEKPIVSILNPYLDQEEYCQTCFKKIIFQDNIEEKKENFCSKECELKSKESKKLFNNIFSTDETTEKSYISTMSSCYGISTYDIESEIIYYDNPEIETININSNNNDIEFQNNNSIINEINNKVHINQTNQFGSIPAKDITTIFNYTEDSDNNNNIIENNHINVNQEVNDNNDVEIIKIDGNFDNDNNNNYNDRDDNDENENENEDEQIEIDKDSLLQFFDSKTKSTTTSGVNEKIISYYKQLCWEKEYFYPLLILKLLILIIQDELCFKKKIKLLGISPNRPPTSTQNPHNLQQHQKLIKNNFPCRTNNNIRIYNNPNQHQQQKQQQQEFQLQPQSQKSPINNTPLINHNNKNCNEKPMIYTLWDHIETFPYIENYPKYHSNINSEINNEFSKHDLKFFNLIHTLFYDAFYEFEDC
eukprot:jgi/Orpsp1_1/1191113/evm.model.d7180000083592.1